MSLVWVQVCAILYVCIMLVACVSACVSELPHDQVSFVCNGTATPEPLAPAPQWVGALHSLSDEGLTHFGLAKGDVRGYMCESEVGDEVRADLESKLRRWQGSAWLWEQGRGGGGKTTSGEWNKKRSSRDGGRGHVFIFLKSKAGCGVQGEWATTKQRAGGLRLCRTKSALKDKERSDSWGRGQTGAEGRGRER